MSNAILFRAPFGIPGNLSRGAAHAIIEPAAFNPSLPFPGYGLPGQDRERLVRPDRRPSPMSSTGFSPVRSQPRAVNASDPLGTSVPPKQWRSRCDGVRLHRCHLQCRRSGTGRTGVRARREMARAARRSAASKQRSWPAPRSQSRAQSSWAPADASGNVSVRFTSKPPALVFAFYRREQSRRQSSQRHRAAFFYGATHEN